MQFLLVLKNQNRTFELVICVDTSTKCAKTLKCIAVYRSEHVLP